MDVRKLVLLGSALIVAAITAIMARSLFSSAAGTPALAAPAPIEPAGPQVLVATRALPVGTILQPDSFRYQPWPKDLVQRAYYLQGEGEPPQAGTVVRYAITAGQPITQGALVKPGDRGFLAAALGPGMRAVTVPVDAKSGVAGFVFPGDRIDLVLTQTVESRDDGAPLKTSETFVRNIRVLATDQKTDNSTKDGKSEATVFSTVTLEATPRIAEKIALAQALGQLSLSLRSIADNEAELERAIAAGEVDVNGKDARSEKQMLLAVASRPIDTDTTFITGGDVSRFARRSMPRLTAPAPAAAPAAAAAPNSSAPAAPRGPIVKVARGNTVTVVTIGAR